MMPTTVLGKKGQVDDFADSLIGILLTAFAIGLLLFGGYAVRGALRNPDLANAHLLDGRSALLTLARTPLTFEGRPTTVAALLGEYPLEADAARRAGLRRELEATFAAAAEGTAHLVASYHADLYPTLDGQDTYRLEVPGETPATCLWEYRGNYPLITAPWSCAWLPLPDRAGNTFYLMQAKLEGSR